MPGIKAAIIGGDERALKVCRMLKTIDGVEVLGLADPNMQPWVAREAAGEGVLVTADIAALLKRPQLDVILAATNSPELRAQLYSLKPACASVVEGPALELVLALLLEHVNPAFTKTADVPSAKFGQVANSRYTFKDILGKSPELRRCLRLAEKVATTNSTVLLLGETGTGKELFAHAIHHASTRRNKPFIKVNCAAIPESLLESEFFGYERGAFTGAERPKTGKLELAHGGTIFLDEVGDLSPALQGKLLRVLQDMEFERVGGHQTIKVDARVIAATNRNLKELVGQGKFREDLYYRLGVVEITIPPLRQRREDLPLLVNGFIAKLNRKLGKKVKGLTKEAEELLMKYDWPGNVRELENVLERVMLTADEEVLDAKHFAPHVSIVRYDWMKNIEVVPLETMEKLLIAKALAKYGTSTAGKVKAAEELKISLSTLYNKLKKYRFGSLIMETG